MNTNGIYVEIRLEQPLKCHLYTAGLTYIFRKFEVHSTPLSVSSVLSLYTLWAPLLLLSPLSLVLYFASYKKEACIINTPISNGRDTAIQLHHVAQDQLGYGRWSHCDEELPTRPDDMLAAFDISDPEHPMSASNNKPATEETLPEEKSQGSSRDQTPQESSVEPSDQGSFLNTSFTVRQASADGHSHGSRSNRFPDIDEDLEGNQERPSTAP